MSKHLILPHGGELVELGVAGPRATELRDASRDWPSWGLTDRQVRDLELLMNGGFSPLRGFLNQADYEGVRSRMRLADGTLWPIPITLDIPRKLAERLEPGGPLALRDPEGVLLASMTVGDLWEPDRAQEAEEVYGTTNQDHPGCGLPPQSIEPGLRWGKRRGGPGPGPLRLQEGSAHSPTTPGVILPFGVEKRGRVSHPQSHAPGSG